MSNFKYADMDGNGVMSFMERKFVANDLDFSGTISKNEWRLGDFPEAYGPFEGHANCTDSTSEAVSLPEMWCISSERACAHATLSGIQRAHIPLCMTETCVVIVCPS